MCVEVCVEVCVCVCWRILEGHGNPPSIYLSSSIFLLVFLHLVQRKKNKYIVDSLVFAAIKLRICSVSTELSCIFAE